MTISVSTMGRPSRLRVSGDLDLGGGDRLEGLVAPLLTAGVGVELHLGEVPFADSSGLGALIALTQLAADEGTALVLVDPSPAIVSVLDTTDTLRLFTIRQHAA